MSYEDWSDQELVEELCDAESGLSDWEADFADSLAGWMKKNDSLTGPQRKKAVEILEEM